MSATSRSVDALTLVWIERLFGSFNLLMFISKGHCVVVFNEEGDFVRRIGGENITNFPNGIDVSDAGELDTSASSSISHSQSPD
jgi:hypothetical protein